MRVSDFRRMALVMPGVIEAEHMGHPDFRAAGRIFATLHADGRHGMVKLSPEQQKQFVTEQPAMFVPENGAWGRQGCTRVMISPAEQEIVGEAMTLAWRNVVMAPVVRKGRRAPTKPKAKKPKAKKPKAKT